MPLNLLGKKSWNPHLDRNVLRVKADEDAFADRAETLGKLKDEHESNVQYAQLSRREAPPLPEKIQKLEQLQQDALNGRLRPDYEGTTSREHYRKRRKLHGEDDTDRDIRVAKDTDGGADPIARRGYRSSDASLKGQDGHLQLFMGAAQQARLPDARQANPSRNEPSDMPWYAGGNYSKNKEDTGLNVLGKEDPGLQRRAQSRTTSMDPLSMMKSAQGKIKGSERDRGNEDTAPDTHIITVSVVVLQLRTSTMNAGPATSQLIRKSKIFTKRVVKFMMQPRLAARTPTCLRIPAASTGVRNEASDILFEYIAGILLLSG
ncbi:MAG: hypothetical protein Q9159_004733 [Coniocarpon cinnabarinum]